MRKNLTPRFIRLLLPAVGLAVGLLASPARAQLQWGVNGAGGSGSWDDFTANWWNGTSNVAWDGGTAVFAGTGGTVTSFTFGPYASGLKFDSPGYTVQSGWVNTGTTVVEFPVTTNAPATLASIVNASLSGSVLVKRGAAPLTVTGTNPINAVHVEEGEYIVGGNGSLFFANVVLADAPSAAVTLRQDTIFASMASLAGGGASGGIVQPDASARTVTLSLYHAREFGGVLQDNGPGQLALTLLSSTETQTFTGANTYTGATTTSGPLIYRGNGSAAFTSSLTLGTAPLRLDNTETALSQRLSDTAAVAVRGGQIELLGNATTAVDEHLGPLSFGGATSISATRSGSAPTLLTFASAERQKHATLDFSGTGRVGWTGLANNATGIAGPAYTYGNEWAAVGVDARLEPLAVYASDLATATAVDHVKLTASTVNLASSASAATLNWQNNTGTAGVLDLGGPGRTVSVSDGGVLSSGTNRNTIQGGTLQVGAAELVIVNRNDLTISSEITETISGTALIKTGAGALALTGSNHYSGATVINQGTLVVGSDAALGTGSAIEFNGGTLQASASFSSGKAITRGSDLAATIDTAGYDVTLSGAISGGINKIGVGTLLLPSTTAPDISLSAGTLLLPEVASGSVQLKGGTLSVAGTLDNLEISRGTTLDIGGASAGFLQTTNVRGLGARDLRPNGELTIRTGIGSDALNTDRWSIGSCSPAPSSFQRRSVLFDFQNLGGARTGTTYTLINLPTNQSYGYSTYETFGFAPAALAAGWKGNFFVASSNVKIIFTAVPEPGSTLLLSLGLFGLASRRVRRSLMAG